MKNMAKRVLVVVLAVAMIACVACMSSCGGEKTTSYTAKNTEYVIGATGPLTGDAASYGNSVKNGAELAVKQINANGGLNGVNFKYDIKDDQAAADKAQTGYDALYESGMQISTGSVTSGSCKAFAAKAMEDGVVFMTPSASEAAILTDYNGGKTAFRVCFSDPEQGTLAAQKFASVGYTKVGCIYDTSSSYSVGIYDAFKAEMDKQGMTFTTQTFDAENNKDFATQVSALAGCDVIFLPMYYTEASLIVKEAAKQGNTADIFGSDGFDGIADMFTSADNISNKIEYITPFDASSTDATVSAFVSAYVAEYGETPDQFAADGYDAVMALYNAMKVAGINDVTMSAADMGAKVAAVLTSGTFSYTGATGSMTWSSDGACNKSCQTVVLNLG